MKPANVALTLLIVLICLSPLAWWLGIDWYKVAIADGIWLALWLVISWGTAILGRQRRGSR